MRTGVALWLTIVCSLVACAIQEPPSGGPVDEKPPRIESTFPAAGSAGVAPDTEIRLGFDESMTRTRMERFLTSYPRFTVGRTRWKKNTFHLKPLEPLHPDTTYLIEIQPGFSDVHGVPNAHGFRFAFATSAAIDSGSISGHVFFRRQPSQSAVVRLFVLPKDTVFAPEAGLPDRETIVSPDGEYRFDFLPTDEERVFVLWAFEDKDGNGAFVADTDVGAGPPDTTTLSADNPTLTEIAIFIVDPKEPAQISGKIINSTDVDTVPVTVSMSALSDTMPPTYVTRSSPAGEFQFSDVLKGTYTLTAFIDFRPDSLCGTFPCGEDSTQSCVEPCAQYPDTLTIEPGQQIELEDLLLGKRDEE